MGTSTIIDRPLALLGGPRAADRDDEPELFHWPIVTREDEEAIVGVLRRGDMSRRDQTMAFEAAWGAYQGTEHNLGFCNGTADVMAPFDSGSLARS